MEALILDRSFNAVGIVDAFEAFIWTERYNKCGDFELHVAASESILNTIRIDYYIYLSESDRLMIVEAFQLTTDPQQGNKLKISGRSLESILDRRIVWEQTMLDGYLQGQVKKLINQNIISPADSNRCIPNFVFEDTDDPTILAMQIRSQYTGDNLYEVICAICEDFGIGFKITLNASNQFVFKLFNGADRSYDQNSNSPVIFSPQFDNLLETAYSYNNVYLKTIGLVAGEGEGSERKTIDTGDDTITGLDRKELYIDARDLSTNDGEISDAEYYLQLMQRGDEKLAECTIESYFEGSMETQISFRYGIDFFIGDIVEVENEFGISARCRISDFVRAQDARGFSAYPSFEMV